MTFVCREENRSFWAGPMPKSKWPAENKLNYIVVDSLSHISLLVLFHFVLLTFCLYIMVTGLVFSWIFLESLSVCMCVFLVFFSFLCLFICFLKRGGYGINWVDLTILIL